ncbi:MAG: hypothetical protein COV44_06075 [Deltaproteobacteria bacterium CG11_big_fil_rev_8_21_14_0_20_45_16]|nr:MAG: hypothetical protein COV44_06075 [Deltaproteobacteria bacterium CG11_big_fil_rev_8_21_14_0_20_45_16]
MTEIADIFSSRAKFKVLKLLIQYSQPIPLRTVANLLNLPIRSVVVALDALSKQKIVRDSPSKHNRLFQMDQSHPLYEELKNIFAQIEKSEIKIRSITHQPEATKAHKFAQSVNQLFSSSR